MCDYSRYLARRTLLLKAFVLLYTVFNTQVGFPGVLNAMHGGDGPCTIAFVLRYINAQPLLTSCVVTMVRACLLNSAFAAPILHRLLHLLRDSQECNVFKQEGYIHMGL